MRVEYVELNNYGGFYGYHKFVIAKRGLVLVLGENHDEPLMNSNGAGKSTVFDAIDWCWFGVPPRGDHADSVINDEAGKQCWVQTQLVDDDKSVVQVRRGRKPNGLQLHVNGEKKTALDPSETQRLVNQRLGLDREIFHAAVYFAQSDRYRFAELKDKDRMGVLSRIYPELGQIDEFADAAKQRVAQIQKTIADLELVLHNRQGQLQGLQTLDLEEQEAQWEAQREQQMAQTQAQLGASTSQIEECQQQQLALGVIATEPITIPEDTVVQKALQQVHQIEGQLRVLERAEALAYSECGQVVSELHGMEGLAGICPTCRQQVAGEHLQVEVAKIEAKKVQVTAVHQECVRAKEEGVELLWKSRREYDAAVVERTAAVQALNQQEQLRQQKANAWYQYQNQVNTLTEGIENLNVQWKTLQEAMNPFTARIQENTRRVFALDLEVKDLDCRIKNQQDQLRYEIFWVHGFSQRGLKSFILDSKLQELTDAVNHWVRVLTGGTIWVRFESQTMGRSTKTLSNKINIRVFRYRPDGTIVERNYLSWSGGEKKRVSLAIDFGLAQLIARRATKQHRFLILDEVFKYVDSRGGAAIMDMLTSMAAETDSIFVVEHDEAFQALFPQTLMVQRKGCRSFVEDPGNDQSVDQRTGKRQRRKIPKRVPIRKVRA